MKNETFIDKYSATDKIQKYRKDISSELAGPLLLRGICLRELKMFDHGFIYNFGAFLVNHVASAGQEDELAGLQRVAQNERVLMANQFVFISYKTNFSEKILPNIINIIMK